MQWLARAADKTGALGSIVAAASCPACFPALAGLGAALGIGFLAEFEGWFIRVGLPLFAGLALIANADAWRRHRRWPRGVLGLLGPAAVLAAMLLFFGHWWTAQLLYAGLALMTAVALWDLWRPAGRRACASAGAGAVTLESVLTCPHCGHARRETMPTDACTFFYECERCHAMLRPKPGDCCVFCSYGSVKCPPVQAQAPCCA